MKCPKCGSKLFKTPFSSFCINENCENKYKDFRQKELYEIEYQARLDKVLSKFERDEEEMRYEILTHIYVYFTTSNRFIMWDANMNKATNKLSLDTVELLLRDLGEDNA